MDGYIAQQALAGKMFIGSTTYAGVKPPAYNATAQKFGIWNPLGSGVDVVLGKLNLALATVGTEAVGAFGLSYLTPAGGQVATGSPITAFTATAPVNAKLGEGQPSRVKFTLAATITAPTFFYNLGLAQAGTDAEVGFAILQHDFNGWIVIPPGVYVGLGSSAATDQTLQGSLTWYEVLRG